MNAKEKQKMLKEMGVKASGHIYAGTKITRWIS